MDYEKVVAEIQSQADAAFKVERSREEVVDALVLPPESVRGPRNTTVNIVLSNGEEKNYDVSMSYVDDLFASEETYLLKEALEEWRDNGYPTGAIFSTPRELQ